MRLKLSAFAVLFLALAMGIPAPQTQSRADVPQPLLDRAAAGEDVSVIAAVGGRFVPEGNLGGARAVALQRAAIREQVADVMRRAAAAGVAVGASFETIPFFTARVNRTSLDALATTAGVTQIGEDARMRPTLTVSAGLVNAPSAWAAGHTGAGWGVAVLDTGVDSTHAFLGGRVSAQACYSNALGLGDPATSSVCPGGVNSDTSGGGPCPANVDGCGHGTHVAGIVAGDGGPSGARGIAPAASIVAVQVFSQLTSTDCAPAASPCTTAYTSDIIRGLQRVLALRNGGLPIAAVNMSLGGGLFPGANCDGADAGISATKTAIDNLLSVGVASIVAAGNEEAAGAIASPACISTAVAVGATTRGVCPGSALCPSGAQAGLPNVPVFSNHSIAVDVLAPGVTINSSLPGGGFAALNGTSMAAPHVAGAWAVLKHAAVAASPSQILTALSTTGTPITEPFTGIAKPLINLNAARLNLLGGGGGLPGAPTSFNAVANGNTISMSWNASADVSPIGIAAAATNYHLIARLAPASAPVVVLPLGNVTSFGVTAPNGTFFLSVQGINGAGAGPESNQVQVTTPAVPPPPGTPTNLVATVVGTSATFTWSAPTSGGPVGNYVLLAGNLPSPAPALVSVPLPASPTAVGFSGIPPGVWYVRVFAQNAGGNSANSSNQVQFTIAGPAPPGAPTLNAPVVVAGNVTLSWAPAAGNVPTSYTLLASATSGGAPFLSVPGLSGTGAAFGGVPSGTYFLRLVAVNAVGASTPSNQVTLVVP